MFGLYGKLTAHPGKGPELTAHLLEAAALLRDVAGCHAYIVSSADPDTIWITEVWQSREAHQASLQLDSLRQIIKAAGPLLATSPESFEVTPHGGVGLPS